MKGKLLLILLAGLVSLVCCGHVFAQTILPDNDIVAPQPLVAAPSLLEAHHSSGQEIGAAGGGYYYASHGSSGEYAERPLVRGAGRLLGAPLRWLRSRRAGGGAGILFRGGLFGGCG